MVPLMLDLFAGLGGASQAMRDRWWRVVTVELDPAFKPDVVADVCAFQWDGPCPDFLWASPPCTEFARESMPWCRTGVPPDTSLVEATLRIIEQAKPKWWVIENVRGAVPWLTPILGPPKFRTGPIYLWGEWPPMLFPKVLPWKERLSSTRKAERAMMPYELSHAFAVAVERAVGRQPEAA